MKERRSGAAIENVIEAHRLANGYVKLDRDAFERDRAVSLSPASSWGKQATLSLELAECPHRKQRRLA